MRMKLFTGVAFAALLIPGAAFAQSTGSIDFEEEGEIVVTGSRTTDVAGIEVPDTSKAKAVLTQEFISRGSPGQSINETINAVPGVSFQNSDPFGSAGGRLTIRGFDQTRISATQDGVPLNDSGSYDIFHSQQIDAELIEQVNVNLGTTDVDSPTAGATGSTVNYRTRVPGEEFGVKVVGTAGEFDYFRTFGMIDTGAIGPWGTRAFISASQSRNNVVFNNIGKIKKQQYNARLYQPLGDNGDFLSVSANYSLSRNNFQGSLQLREDLTLQTVTGTAPNQTVTTVPRTVGSATNQRFPVGDEEPYYLIARCLTNQVARPGVADTANTCGSTFDERFNPSNTGNFRGTSKFTLSDKATLTIDPSYQFVKANGGGGVVGLEGFRDVNPSPTIVSNQVGYIAGLPYFGRDLNGDGDLLDTIRVVTPSQTGTRRIGLIASLRYDLSDTQSARIAYTYDRARHRQTGEVGFLQVNGVPFDVFPINDPLKDSTGSVLQKRDRLSYAILHQVSGEYRGEFFDDVLAVTLGLRMPFFKRNLNNYCATSSAAGFVECFGSNTAGLNAYLAANPTVTIGGTAAAPVTAPIQGPQQRIYNFKKALPNVGLTFKLTPQVAAFGNFSKGLQVPGTDNLYQSFFFPLTVEQANPRPETTDNFDVGLRYRSPTFQAQVTGWYTNYQNRLASSFDPDLDRVIYRNLGQVKKYGVDGSASFQPLRALSIYATGSYLKSEIQEDVLVGRLANGNPIFAPTRGKREGGSPEWTFGGGATLDLDYVSLGVNAKRTGPRYVYDTNEPVRQLLTVNGVQQITQIYPNKTPAYTLVDLNARVGLQWAGLNDKTYFQFNMLNAFDQNFVAGFQSNLNQGPAFNATTGAVTSYGLAPNAQLGYPRTIIGSLIVGF